MRLDVAGIEVRRLLEVAHGFVEIAAVAQGLGELHVRDRRSRIGFDRAPVFCERGIRLSLLRIHVRPADDGVDELGVLLQNQRELLERFVEPSLVREREAKVIPR